MHCKGYFYQGDISRFHAPAGKQYVLNSILAIIYLSLVHSNSWTSHEIHYILKTAHSLYNSIHNNEDLLYVIDIPNNLHILGHAHFLQHCESLSGLLNYIGYNIESYVIIKFCLEHFEDTCLHIMCYKCVYKGLHQH